MAKLFSDTTKPFVMSFIAESTQATAINPNGWKFDDGSYNVSASPADFRSRMIAKFTSIRDNAIRWGADLVYIWDLWGQRLPHVFTYSGDPTTFQTLAPEMFTTLGGMPLIDELLEILTDAGLLVGTTFRPQRFYVQTSGSLPSDTSIRVLLRLDVPWTDGPNSQFWHRGTWATGGGSAPDDTWYQANSGYYGLFQQESYTMSVNENEIRRKLDFLATRWPQITHLYVDTTVDPDGTPFGQRNAQDSQPNIWANIRGDYPTIVISQEQQYSPDDEASSAPYGQTDMWDTGPTQATVDRYPDAQHFLTTKGTPPDTWNYIKDTLVAQVARERVKIGGRDFYDDTDPNGDFVQTMYVLDGAAAWTPPAAETHNPVPTTTLTGWTFEAYNPGADLYATQPCGSVVGSSIRMVDDYGQYQRAKRRLGDIVVGSSPRVLSFTIGNATTQARVILRDPFDQIVYNSGPLGNGSHTSPSLDMDYGAYNLTVVNVNATGDFDFSAITFVASGVGGGGGDTETVYDEPFTSLASWECRSFTDDEGTATTPDTDPTVMLISGGRLRLVPKSGHSFLQARRVLTGLEAGVEHTISVSYFGSTAAILQVYAGSDSSGTKLLEDPNGAQASGSGTLGGTFTPTSGSIFIRLFCYSLQTGGVMAEYDNLLITKLGEGGEEPPPDPEPEPEPEPEPATPITSIPPSRLRAKRIKARRPGSRWG